jgi:hypothetical protein
MESTLLERWRVHQPNVSLRVQHSRPENSAASAGLGRVRTRWSRRRRDVTPAARLEFDLPMPAVLLVELTPV